MTQEISPKSRLATFLLCGFLGTLGIHRFYVGKIGTGIIQLVLTLTFVGMIITSPWALIDFIIIGVGAFTDKKGQLIKKWTD